MKTKTRVRGLFLNVTTRCNMTCPKCYGHLREFGAMDMALDVAKKATEIFFNNRMEQDKREQFQSVIMFFGGEPTLNHDLVCQYIKWMETAYPRAELDYRFAMVTNGLEMKTEFLRTLIQHEVEIFISLDGPKEISALRRQAGKGGYENLLKNIRVALDECQNHLLWTYTVISREQIQDIDQLLDYFKELGFQRMAVSKDFYERFWDRSVSDELLRRLQEYKCANPGVSIAVYPEFTGGCEDCRPMYMMVYPNGDIRDLCFTSGAVVHCSGLIPEKELAAYSFGNVWDKNHLYFDLERKRETTRPHIHCATISRLYDQKLLDLL